jgi:hypothetical protein
MQHTTETTKQYQCRHIFTDGHRCGSPCLRGEDLCYYHHTTRKPVANPQQRRGRRSTFDLPLPEDRSAIQHSIGEVLRRIAANDIDPRRAGLLLYGLQIASLNLPKQQNTQRNTRPEPIETVEEIIIDPTLGVLAPRAEVGEAENLKSPVTLLLERMMQSDQEETTPPKPTILPTLNAESTTTDHHEDGCPTSRVWDVGSTDAPGPPHESRTPQAAEASAAPSTKRSVIPTEAAHGAIVCSAWRNPPLSDLATANRMAKIRIGMAFGGGSKTILLVRDGYPNLSAASENGV